MLSLYLSWIMYGVAFIGVILVNGPFPSSVIMNGVALTFIIVFDKVILDYSFNEIKNEKMREVSAISKKDLTVAQR